MIGSEALKLLLKQIIDNNAAASFVSLFLEKFSTEEKQNLWHHQLNTLRQGPYEKLRKNIVLLITFSHSKNVKEAIDAAKQVEKQLSLNYATLSNTLSAQLEGKPEKRKPKDDRNLTKVWDTKA
ncbi:9237_t:CDS:2 [Funneliformis caledonium]|uniref:9237_t:CDS:1 n=1 Tax=Funneliformis caledonium TaxID=1117310 RepID=A0A9N9DGS5_9GLOM|nr:9237_t:CDS:2 [Funneliformis caledonium]